MESRENHDISKELNKERYREDAKLLEKAKEKMAEMEIFNKDFIESLDFVFVDITEKDGKYQEAEYRLTEDGSFILHDNKNSERAKEVGIITTSYLNKFEQLFDGKSEKRKSTHVWLGNLDKSVFLSFDAAAAHEIAHAKSYSVIDKEGKSSFDKEKFKRLIADLVRNDTVLSKPQSIDFSKFDYLDEDWSELYALLYHREFLRRENNNNNKMLEEWDKHIAEVAGDLYGAMEKFNQEKGTAIDTEIVYKDYHALSFLLARLFEEKYNDFDKRIKILESCRKE